LDDNWQDSPHLPVEPTMTVEELMKLEQETCIKLSNKLDELVQRHIAGYKGMSRQEEASLRKAAFAVLAFKMGTLAHALELYGIQPQQLKEMSDVNFSRAFGLSIQTYEQLKKTPEIIEQHKERVRKAIKKDHKKATEQLMKDLFGHKGRLKGK
jgi:hypothetical protein